MKRARRDENRVNRVAPRAKRARLDPIERWQSASHVDHGYLAALLPEVRARVWEVLALRDRVRVSRTCRGLHREFYASAWGRTIRGMRIPRPIKYWPAWSCNGALVDAVYACLTSVETGRLNLTWLKVKVDAECIVSYVDLGYVWKRYRVLRIYELSTIVGELYVNLMGEYGGNDCHRSFRADDITGIVAHFQHSFHLFLTAFPSLTRLV